MQDSTKLRNSQKATEEESDNLPEPENFEDYILIFRNRRNLTE